MISSGLFQLHYQTMSFLSSEVQIYMKAVIPELDSSDGKVHLTQLKARVHYFRIFSPVHSKQNILPRREGRIFSVTCAINVSRHPSSGEYL